MCPVKGNFVFSYFFAFPYYISYEVLPKINTVNHFISYNAAYLQVIHQEFAPVFQKTSYKKKLGIIFPGHPNSTK